MNNAITTTSTTAITTNTSAITADLMTKWVTFIDAKPRTIETYTHNIKQFFVFMQANDITEPTREDIISYRDALKVTHKPATVQEYNYDLFARPGTSKEQQRKPHSKCDFWIGPKNLFL